jgi:hypothetical protein
MTLATLPDMATVGQVADDTSKVGMMGIGLVVLVSAVVWLYRDNRIDRKEAEHRQAETYSRIAERDKLFTSSLRELTQVLSAQRESFHALSAQSEEASRIMIQCHATKAAGHAKAEIEP